MASGEDIAPALLSAEEEFFITREADQYLHEQEIPADFEDHLKEFFEGGREESATKEEPGHDFPEYVDGVEFDGEEQNPGTAFKPAGETEEVVFEAVDEENHSDREFGERLEEDQDLMGTEIRMEGFPETPNTDEIRVAEGGKTRPADDTLSPLRNCIASLGIEINDALMESLFNEINKLNDLWISRPVEKIFLQLLSTVARHIDDYRQEASPDAQSLLLSIFNKLEFSGLTGSEITKVQEDLFSETSKILLWQQKMLARKAKDQGEDSGTAIADAGYEREGIHPEPALFFEQEREGLSSREAGEEQGNGREPAVMNTSSRDTFDEGKIGRIVRDELEKVRESLMVEMADLIRRHLDREPSERKD